jgi:predicted TPR repeat methyltransferase
VSEVESFRSPFRWDIVTMIESIYYIRIDRLASFLSGVMGLLTESGRFVYRIHDVQKHRMYVDTISQLYPHTERVSENLFCTKAPGFGAGDQIPSR